MARSEPSAALGVAVGPVGPWQVVGGFYSLPDYMDRNGPIPLCCNRNAGRYA